RTHGYVQNPLREMDPLGLQVCQERIDRYKELRAKGYSAQDAARLSKTGADGTLPELPGKTGNPGGKVDYGSIPLEHQWRYDRYLDGASKN
ncbi:hypothetical protein ACPV4W_23045, partial [Vibrio diabolicus]